ncbi:hypothetical protein lerEdw1_007024, partial [Lerista edwardsae]
RVVLPCSVEEYQVGQLFSVAEASKNNTGGGEGIEVLTNEPYEREGERGQYTHKIYHLQSKVPGFIKMFAPEGSLVVHERAWNAYPYCRTGEPCGEEICDPFLSPLNWGNAHTVMFHRNFPEHSGLLGNRVFLPFGQNEYMKDDFFIKIETWHKPDLGDQDNVHGLDAETWKDVDVVHIDIADRTQVSDDVRGHCMSCAAGRRAASLQKMGQREQRNSGDYKPDEDPALFKSLKTSRGPLGTDWKRELANNEDCPHMCAYKLVTVKFRWWGLQGRVEKFIQK